MNVIKKLFRPLYLWLFSPTLRYRMVPMLARVIGYNERETLLDRVFAFVDFSHTAGDYFEFGVWKARTFKSAYHLSRPYPFLRSMHFYGFDSFEGLPPTEGLDATTDEFKEGDFTCSLDEVNATLARAKVPAKRVTLIPGWFKDSLTEETRKKLPAKSAAVVYVDCDLYESTVPVLDFITPYVVDGTVLIFDDWYCFKADPNKGEQRAFREWLAKNPQISATPYHQFAWSGNSFVLHRSGK